MTRQEIEQRLERCSDEMQLLQRVVAAAARRYQDLLQEAEQIADGARDLAARADDDDEEAGELEALYDRAWEWADAQGIDHLLDRL